MSEVSGLKAALGFGIAALATEHYFTFTLSSLPSTKRFFSDAEGRKDVRASYGIASGLSLATGAITSILLKSPIAFISTIALTIGFVYIYERALRGKIG